MKFIYLICIPITCNFMTGQFRSKQYEYRGGNTVRDRKEQKMAKMTKTKIEKPTYATQTKLQSALKQQ